MAIKKDEKPTEASPAPATPQGPKKGELGEYLPADYEIVPGIVRQDR